MGEVRRHTAHTEALAYIDLGRRLVFACFFDQRFCVERLKCTSSLAAVSDSGRKMSVTITSPHATIFSEHHREKVKTAFTTTEAGPHWICVQNEDEQPADVKMSVLSGPQA